MEFTSFQLTKVVVMRLCQELRWQLHMLLEYCCSVQSNLMALLMATRTEILIPLLIINLNFNET